MVYFHRDTNPIQFDAIFMNDDLCECLPRLTLVKSRDMMGTPAQSLGSGDGDSSGTGENVTDWRTVVLVMTGT